jgi:heme/copper-type cytochrome/quinol oxidase subunit 1
MFNFLAGRLLVPVTTVAPVSDVTVAFYAYFSNHVNLPSGHHILKFDTVITNTGNAYHSHTGTVIAPRSGLYVFTWTMRMARPAYHSTELLLNRNIVGVTYFNSDDNGDGSATGTVVVHVKPVS